MNDKLDVIGIEITESSIPDSSDEETLYDNPRDEKAKELIEIHEQQVDKLFQKVDYFKDLHNLRRNVAIFIFVLIFVWLTCVMYLVFLGSYEVFYFQGECSKFDIHSWYQKFKSIPKECVFVQKSTYLNLSESIVIALITTTTINVLGLSYIVARWLFPTNGIDDSTKKTYQNKQPKI